MVSLCICLVRDLLDVPHLWEFKPVCASPQGPNNGGGPWALFLDWVRVVAPTVTRAYREHLSDQQRRSHADKCYPRRISRSRTSQLLACAGRFQDVNPLHLVATHSDWWSSGRPISDCLIWEPMAGTMTLIILFASSPLG